MTLKHPVLSLAWQRFLYHSHYWLSATSIIRYRWRISMENIVSLNRCQPTTAFRHPSFTTIHTNVLVHIVPFWHCFVSIRAVTAAAKLSLHAAIVRT